MIPTYVAKLDLTTPKTSIGIQQIDGSLLKIYSMAFAKFPLQNSLERVQFFEESFVLVNTSMDIVLEMLFFYLSNTDIKFPE